MNKKTSTNLNMFLNSLSKDRLKNISQNITSAGLVNEFGGNYKKLFKSLRDKASGKEKKIYSAISKFNEERAENMFNAITKVDRSALE